MGDRARYADYPGPQQSRERRLAGMSRYDRGSVTDVA